jgi:hypothetical protein
MGEMRTRDRDTKGLKEIKKGVRDGDVKEIIPRCLEIKAGHFYVVLRLRVLGTLRSSSLVALTV